MIGSLLFTFALSSHARKDVVTITCQFLTFPGSLTIVYYASRANYSDSIKTETAKEESQIAGDKAGETSRAEPVEGITIVQTRGREFMFHGEK